MKVVNHKANNGVKSSSSHKVKLTKRDAHLISKGFNIKTGTFDSKALKTIEKIAGMRAKTQQELAKYGQIGASVASLAPSAAIGAANSGSEKHIVKETVTVNGTPTQVSKPADGSTSVLDWIK